MRIKYLSISLALSLALGGILLVFWLRAENENDSNNALDQGAGADEVGNSADPDTDLSEQPAQGDGQKHDDVNKLMDAWGDYILEGERVDHNSLSEILAIADLKYYSSDNLYFNGVPLGDANDESNSAHLGRLYEWTEVVATGGSDIRTPPGLAMPDIDGRDNLHVWDYMSCENETPVLGVLYSEWHGVAFHYALE